MALDKGIMRRGLLRMRRLTKKQGWFTGGDIGIYSSGIARMVRYGIIEKDEGGKYKLTDPSKDPVLQYKQLSTQWRRKPRNKPLASAAKQVSRQTAEQTGPLVTITRLHTGGEFIQINDKQWIGYRVAFLQHVKKPGRQG